MKKYFAEMLGTMVLVLMGCGSAVFSGHIAGIVGTGVGTLGVALAFGLSVVAMAYTIGNISGCHINPAITLGVWLSGRMKGKEACMYMLFQVIGAIIGSAIIYALVSTGIHEGPTLTGANTYTEGTAVQACHRGGTLHLHLRSGRSGSHEPRQGQCEHGGTGDRSYADARPYRLHPHHGYLRQSRTQYRAGHLPREAPPCHNCGFSSSLRS